MSTSTGEQDVRPEASRQQERSRRWRFSKLNLAVALLLVAGLTMLVYPSAAAWVSQRNQSNIVYDQALANSQAAQEDLDRMFKDAHAYNDLLESGALLAGGANVAQGTGERSSKFNYWDMLNADPTGTMARLKVPSIDLDLPVYHGTSDATLLKGVGHLEGTSLPVGGKGTRSVLTGHRGLANATMFTNLDAVKKGDIFSVEVLGQVFSYKVSQIQVVEPDDSEEIRAVPGKDLMTLVTCTPLGINTHRILVTGERVTPTPAAALNDLDSRPVVPGFPWWIVIYVSGLILIGLLFWWSGYPRRKKPTKVQDDAPQSPEEG